MEILSDAAKLARKAYYSEWHKKNPGKNYEYFKKWKNINPEKYQQCLKNWRRNNPEKVKSQIARYWERRAMTGNETVMTDNKTVMTDNETVVTDNKNTCIVCGNLFTAKRKDAKICSHVCRQRNYLKKKESINDLFNS